MNLAERLSALLDESPGDARERAATVFDRVAGTRRIVLVGAGGLGARAAEAMRAAGAGPAAIADSDAGKHGTTVGDMPVLPVELAVRRFPDAAFVVTIWGARSAHRIHDTELKLRALGARVVVPFAWLFWKYHGGLPHYFIDLPQGVLAAHGEVERAFAALGDDRSREAFVAQVEARLSGRVDRLGEPVPGEQYLAADVWQPRPRERVVDGGAFDGDTLRAWLRTRGPDFDDWLAIEPHPENVAALRATVDALDADVRRRVRIAPVALGERPGTIAMPSAGSAGAGAAAARADGGAIEVPVRSLDELVGSETVSFVKLDIEGDELSALEGMRSTLARCSPVIAACAYHRQDHLWRVPLELARLMPASRIHLRAHGAEGWDLVAYAVPPHRAP